MTKQIWIILAITVLALSCEDAQFSSDGNKDDRSNRSGQQFGSQYDPNNPNYDPNAIGQGQGQGNANVFGNGNTNTNGLDQNGNSINGVNSNKGALQLCSEKTQTTQKLRVKFNGTAKGCAWGQIEAPQTTANSAGSDRVSARRTQLYDLPIGANSVLCSMDFRFLSQAIEFDDSITINFNDRILLDTRNRPLFYNKLAQDGVFRIYDFEKIRGNSNADSGINDDDWSTYCPEKSGGSRCSAPPDDTPGTLTLSLSTQANNGIAEMAFRDKRYQFSLITQGNHDSSDCWHTGVEFEVSAKIVPFN